MISRGFSPASIVKPESQGGFAGQVASVSTQATGVGIRGPGCHFEWADALEFFVNRSSNTMSEHEQIQPFVLIIEDDPLMTRLIEKTLKSACGVDVKSAANGSEALKMLRPGAQSPVLILCDMNMPNISGLELVEVLKAASCSCEIPIAVVSGSDDKQDVAQCLAAGAFRYLLKSQIRDEIPKLVVDVLAPATAARKRA